MKNVADVFKRARVIPVLVIEAVDHALPLAECLMEAGLSVLEITLRTSAAYESIKAIKKSIPQCEIGVGSITLPSQVQELRQLGASFGVSPGCSPGLMEAVISSAWPFLPGASTVSEIMALQEKGFSHQKLFPATHLGGVGFLHAIAGPLPQIRFCPTGGITESTTPEYLSLQNVFAVGCSWVAPKELIDKRDWAEIRKRASQAARM